MALIEALREILKGKNPRPMEVWRKVVKSQGSYNYNADELNAVTPAVRLITLEIVEGGDGSYTIDSLKNKETVKELGILYIKDNNPGM